jgi:uncharacterized protein
MPQDPRSIPSLHLARILASTGEVSGEGETDRLDLVRDPIHEGDPPELTPIPLQGTARWKANASNVGGDEFWLSGRVSGTAIMECSRCLEPTPVPVNTTFGHLMRYNPRVEVPRVEYGEDEQETLVFGNPALDLSPVLAEAFWISLPVSVLHAPDCRGLCASCGANLNDVPSGTCAVNRETDCPNIPHDPDHDASSPFAKLRGLLED